jgi:CRISPR-associated exonuclease Cas4
MYITGTHFNYYLICHRKLWLFANSVQMEQTSELVDIGRLIHEESYPKRSERFKEISIDGIKIDYFDSKNNCIHEIKKSDKREEAHTWQLKYYMYILERNGIEDVKGILEYPRMRKTKEVFLSQADCLQIDEMLNGISLLIEKEHIPDPLPKSKCRNCSYFDFCYSQEI